MSAGLHIALEGMAHPHTGLGTPERSPQVFAGTSVESPRGFQTRSWWASPCQGFRSPGFLWVNKKTAYSLVTLKFQNNIVLEKSEFNLESPFLLHVSSPQAPEVLSPPSEERDPHGVATAGRGELFTETPT